MIVGTGVDIVDIARFERQLERTPRLRERLFVPHERELAPRSLAARFAVKEAAAKALKAEGYRVILVNSNPATIMTDTDFAAVRGLREGPSTTSPVETSKRE